MREGLPAVAVAGLIVGLGVTVLGVAAIGTVAFLATRGPTVPAVLAKDLNPLQNRVVAEIFRVFRSEAIADGITMAAIANAYEESRLGLHNYGDNGHAVGIWQLHDQYAGQGMSVADRLHPVTSTLRIIQELRDDGQAVFDAYQQGATIGDLAALFSRDVERPDNEQYQMAVRRNHAAHFWPAVASTPARQVFAA